jgi:hypothetical protein
MIKKIPLPRRYMMDTTRIIAEMLRSHSMIQQKLNIIAISDKQPHNYRLTGKME